MPGAASRINGRKGGRPKGVKNGSTVRREAERLSLQAAAQVYTEEALARLAYWMRTENATASVSACHGLLDRGHGKPPQAITDAAGGPLLPAVVEHRHVHEALPRPDEPRALPPVRPS